MKRYRICMTGNVFIDIETEYMEMIVINNKPVKIRFYDNDENIIAEFYTDNICGWSQLDHVVDP